MEEILLETTLMMRWIIYIFYSDDNGDPNLSLRVWATYVRPYNATLS